MVVFDDEPLSCEDAEGDIYWYRNGELLQFSDATHHLTEDSTDLEGVYQCFILTSDGVWYQHTWRVFDFRGFMIINVICVKYTCMYTECMCIYQVQSDWCNLLPCMQVLLIHPLIFGVR